MTVSWRLESETAGDEVETLALLIRETESGLLAFAIYRGVAEREASVRALKERISLPIKEITLTKELKDPVRLLRELPPERACVLIYDIEAALPDAAGFLNLQRETFGEVPHAVVFWGGADGMRELATAAPDFWAWGSGVFDFRSGQFDRPAMAMRHALGELGQFRDRGDLERRISLYQGLIDEQGLQEKPDEAFLGRMHLRLAWAFVTLGPLADSEAHALRALELSGRSGDQHTEADALEAVGGRALEVGRLDEAEGSFMKALSIRQQASAEADVVASYHYLGRSAQERQHLDEAEEWYRKALEIFERLGLEQHAAVEYHQLGNVAVGRQRLDEAEQWYRRALEISERLGLERYAASGYHQLGIVAEERQQLDEAERWYHKALEISEGLGLERSAADEHHQLGTVALERHRLDEAEQRYRKALEIFERLGLERDAAVEYYRLGIVAKERERLDEAEAWYRKALEIFERLANPPLAVNTIAQLGLLRQQQERPDEAVAWFGRAHAITAQYNMVVGAKVLADLARTMKGMGEEEFTAAWRQAFDGEEPPLQAIREALGQLEKPVAAQSKEPAK